MGLFQNPKVVEAEMRNNYTKVREALEALYPDVDLLKIEAAIFPERTPQDHLAALESAKFILEREQATDAVVALAPYIKVHEDVIAVLEAPVEPVPIESVPVEPVPVVEPTPVVVPDPLPVEIVP